MHKRSKIMLEISANRRRAVVIVSGGMDSCVLAYYYAAAGYHLHLLSFDYGQKHATELTYAKKYIAELRNRYSSDGMTITHNIISLPIAQLSPNSDSALINQGV